MSRPNSPQQGSQKENGLGSSWEREFFRYLPPYHVQANVPNHVGQETKPSDFTIRPSFDPVLTAFAQLGTLRLNSKHALISLFGRKEQHVLTEATRSLSLQNDMNHRDGDELWIGSCTLSYDRSLCKAILNFNQSTDRTAGLLVIPDLSQDDRFAGHQDVAGHPNFRFLACSPIISPKGFVIGAYTILDDKPRGPLNTELTNFMTEISSTVMDYLVATRSRYQQARSERMMVGLGSFLEGKGSLRNAWIATHEDFLSPNEENLEGHINREQQEIQASDSIIHGGTVENPSEVLPLRPKSSNTQEGQNPAAKVGQDQSPGGSRPLTRDYFSDRPRQKRPHQARMSNTRKSSNKQSPKDDYVTEVQRTFSRAANIIRESIEVEAAVFLDAGFTSQDALVNLSARSDSGSSSMCGFSSDEGASIETTSSHKDLSRMAQAEKAGPNALDPCKILGFATSDTSSISNEYIGDRRISVSESFLRHLLRQYPQGKIFNYGKDGSISSDDTSDRFLKQFESRLGGPRYKRTRKAILRQDAATLLQLAPNARSIVFSPLWDSHKERWYSGCISWTKTAHRVLASEDELAFLFTFGNSVMAEVHRLGASMAERAKSNLLAGISHELRSPLHGIFGTIDILGDTTMTVLQRGFLHTISSCALTLLGSIDQLLDYASINDVRPNPPKGSDLTKIGNAQDSRHSSIDECPVIQLDAVVEDSIETVFAGHSYFEKKPTASFDPTKSPLDVSTKVNVVLDIDFTDNMRFVTRPGAWHVILTNIFGNAMKFTQDGFIHVSLKAGPVPTDDDTQTSHSRITLSIKDSGCGVDREFLGNKIFSAFSQENTLSTGNGLGLNIVHRIVSSLDGDIKITSHKSIGTNVVVTVDLEDAHYSPPSPISPNKPLFPDFARSLMHGKTAGILVPTASDGNVALAPSLKKLCEEWFFMKVDFVDSLHARPSHCDVFISLHETLDIGNREILASVSTPKERSAPPVIIICSSPSTAHTMSLASQERGYTGILEFISQPCGPRKLAKAFEMCMQRQQQRKHEPNYFETSFSQKVQADTLKPPVHEARSEHESLEPEFCERCSVLVKTGHSIDRSTSLGQKSSPEHPKCSPTTILLVDDNEINVRLLVAFVEKLGYDYLIARNGQEALDSFKEHADKICVILMDISMPVMDGIEATRRIREHENTLDSKQRAMIVAITGVAQAEVERDAIESGMDTFLTKPIRLDIVGPMIKRKIHELSLI